MLVPAAWKLTSNSIRLPISSARGNTVILGEYSPNTELELKTDIAQVSLSLFTSGTDGATNHYGPGFTDTTIVR